MSYLISPISLKAFTYIVTTARNVYISLRSVNIIARNKLLTIDSVLSLEEQ